MRFPRIKAIRYDKPPLEANTQADLDSKREETQQAVKQRVDKVRC